MCQLSFDTFITLIFGVIDLDFNLLMEIIAHKYCVIELHKYTVFLSTDSYVTVTKY